MKAVILLTGCINPNGMPFTQLTDASERQKQYVDAIHYYINNTDCKIVFCENSNTDISSLFKNEQDRLEILTFAGNQNKQRGKGYGEAEIIEFAIQHSSFISEYNNITKITGRLIIENINDIFLYKFPLQKNDGILCSFHSNLQFADSRIICAPKTFFQLLVNHKEEINDSKDIFFETILAKYIKNSNYSKYPFWIEPNIIGISGSTGVQYTGINHSCHHIQQYKIYVLKQALSLNRLTHNLPLFHRFFYRFLIIVNKIKLYQTEYIKSFGI